MQLGKHCLTVEGSPDVIAWATSYLPCFSYSDKFLADWAELAICVHQYEASLSDEQASHYHDRINDVAQQMAMSHHDSAVRPGWEVRIPTVLFHMRTGPTMVVSLAKQAQFRVALHADEVFAFDEFLIGYGSTLPKGRVLLDGDSVMAGPLAAAAILRECGMELDAAVVGDKAKEAS